MTNLRKYSLVERRIFRQDALSPSGGAPLLRASLSSQQQHALAHQAKRLLSSHKGK